MFLEGGVEGTGKDIRGTLSRSVEEEGPRASMHKGMGQADVFHLLCIHSTEIYSESLKCQVLYLVLKMWQ